MAKGEVWDRWMQENMFKCTLYVNMKNDEELYTALKEIEANGLSKSAALKRWALAGMKAEKRKAKRNKE